MAVTAKKVEKVEFENRTQGYLGVVKIDRKGDEISLPVEPGARVFLTDEEIALTGQAHKRKQDSPFELREIVHFDQATGEETARFTAPPLERVKAAA